MIVDRRLVGGPRHGEMVMVPPGVAEIVVELPALASQWVGADASKAGPRTRRGTYLVHPNDSSSAYWAGSETFEEPRVAQSMVQEGARIEPEGSMRLRALEDLLRLLEREGFIHGPIQFFDATDLRPSADGRRLVGYRTVAVRGDLQ